MTYIPNSIERCTEIVGYDPYAFVMGTSSNINMPNYPAAKGLKDTPNDTFNDKNKNPDLNSNSYYVKKGWATFGKFILGTIGVTAAVVAYKKGKPAIKNAFETLARKANTFIHSDKKLDLIKSKFTNLFSFGKKP